MFHMDGGATSLAIEENVSKAKNWPKTTPCGANGASKWPTLTQDGANIAPTQP